MSDTFDILIIGAGPGGHAATLRSTALGAKAAIIEKQWWGGTCTHRGCIPTKALLACSRRFAELKKIARLGVRAADTSFDFAAMKRHQEQIVKVSAMGVQKSLKDAGVEIKEGEGKIIAPGEVELTEADGSRGRLSARNILIAWGSVPALPPGVGLSERILDSDGLLALQTLPQSMLIVGGSVIGVEFATFFAELGVRVTIVEMMDRILPLEDSEAAALLLQELKKLGIAVLTGMRMQTIDDTGSGVRILVAPNAPSSGEPAAASQELSADYALICTGRKPRLNIEELDGLGIRHDRRGIAVDEHQMTNIEGIYAVGDVTGGMMLAHRAMRQGDALADRLFGNGEMCFLEEAVPSVIYTHPQIARVGLTEEEAVRRGMAVEVHRADYAANITARTSLLGSGFVKLLFAGDKLAGATIVGDQAGELIASLSLAIAAGLTRKQIQAWVLPHPTLSEVLAF